MGFLSSLGYSLVITVSSVALILLCCSMTGWYLTRVNNKLSKFMNLLIVFSMVVPSRWSCSPSPRLQIPSS